MKRALLVLQAILACVASTALGQATEKPSDAKESPYHEAQTGLVFPQEVGKLKLGETHVFAETRLGVGIRYKLPDAAPLDVFVYNNGIQTISSDPNSETLTAELQNTLQSVQKSFAGFTIDERSIVALAQEAEPPQAHRVIFSLGTEDKRVKTAVYLLGYKNHFIKLRATWIAMPPDDALQEFDDFAKWLGSAIVSSAVVGKSE
jgi:hypothetical protein